MTRAVFAIATAALLAASSALAGAYPGPGGPGPPEAGVQIRLGMFMPSGDSDFWDDTEDVFTLDISDFDDFMLGFTYVHPVSNDVELGVNLDFFSETSRSSYRGFVDSFGFSILHDTELSIAPLTVDVRFLPGGRYRMRPGGRQIVKPVFYIGGGIGVVLWEYEEVGDFLDFSFDPPEIFFDRFVDDGVAFEAHALVGVEIPLGRTTNLLFEGRYSISDDDLGGDFGDLPETDIDLGGTAIYGGLSFRF